MHSNLSCLFNAKEMVQINMGCGPSFDSNRIKKSSVVEILDNPDPKAINNSIKNVEVKFNGTKVKIYFRAL